MDLLRRRDLETLASEAGGPHVSIYMPMHRTVPDVEQDRIRLKNLIRQAEERLEEGEHRRKEILPIIDPLRQLHESAGFWDSRSDGLALFTSGSGVRAYKLPARFEATAAVGPRYLLKPLIGFLAMDGRYFILAFSRNRVRLFQASRQSVSEVNVDSAPESLAEALRFDDPERQLQFHTGTAQRGKGTDRSAVFHGHGAGDDDREANTVRFLTQVDRGIHDVLADEHAPLVLVAVDELQAVYRDLQTYPHLIERHAKGNPDEISPEHLHDVTWPLVEPIFKQGLRSALADYSRLEGQGNKLVVNGVRETIPAAHEARVGSLFVASKAHAWGVFDPEAVSVECHDRDDDENIDLLDFAAVRVFSTGGSVYVLPEELVPGGERIAAVLRF